MHLVVPPAAPLAGLLPLEPVDPPVEGAVGQVVVDSRLHIALVSTA